MSCSLWRTFVVATCIYGAWTSDSPAQAINMKHPFVHVRATELVDILLHKEMRPINGALARLEKDVTTLVTRRVELLNVYRGCQLSDYFRTLTSEYGGAAISASRMALYAYLNGLNLGYGKEPTADSAKEISRSIILAWAATAFIDSNGRPISATTFFCSATGEVDRTTSYAVGLVLARGMPYFVHAYDLLLGLDALSSEEQATVNEFLRRVFEIIKNSANYRAEHQHLECNKYSNHVSVQLAGLVAIARIRMNDELLRSVVLQRKI